MIKESISKKNIVLFFTETDMVCLVVYSGITITDKLTIKNNTDRNIVVKEIGKFIDKYKETHFICLQKNKEAISIFLEIFKDIKIWSVILEQDESFYIFLLQQEYEMYVFDDDFTIISDVYSFINNYIKQMGEC